LWHEWWRNFRKTGGGTKEDSGSAAGKIEAGEENFGKEMRCFVTGDLVYPVKTHMKIERLSDVGGLPTGDVLVGFDKYSFRSYGLEQSANAAVSEESAAAYRAALNRLIKEQGQRLAGAKVIHWFKRKIPKEDDPLAWLEESPEQGELVAQQRARELLKSISSGKRSDLSDNYFYALALSGASGRIMVRDWMEGQFSELVENIARWFEDLGVVHREGGRLAADPKFLAVLGATVRQLDDLAAPVVAKMWRVAVRGECIPSFVLAQTLSRVKVDIIQGEPFNHARMGLIKAYHIRKTRGEGGGQLNMQSLGPYLSEDHANPAYHCGRLMAVLAELQRSALGDVGAGIVQRYYAAASSTPALVLGRLTRTSQFHLNKLKPGLAYWYEEKVSSIWSRCKDSLPTVLSLEEQSLFALGYYQQMADMRKKKSQEIDQEKEITHE
jgi:CRISPR-associated protein Csd1